MPPTDQRQLGGTPRPDLEARLRERQPGWQAADIEDAKLFDEVRESRHYETEDCASLAEYGERLRFGAAEVLRWADIGLVLRLDPRAEERLRLGRITGSKLAILKPIYADPRCLEDGRDWLDLAEDCSPRVLRRIVRRRVEEVRQGERVVCRAIHAPERTWEKFDRAKDVASTRARRSLTDGQTVEVLADSFLDRFDPLRRAERLGPGPGCAGSGSIGSGGAGSDGAGSDGAGSSDARGGPSGGGEDPAPRASAGGGEQGLAPEPSASSSGRPEASQARRPSRHIPAPVRYTVWLRAEGTCEFGTCDRRRWLEHAHVQPFGESGPHHPRNILLLCPRHHTRFDRGRIVLVGWSETGRPLLVRRPADDGRKPRPPPSETEGDNSEPPD